MTTKRRIRKEIAEAVLAIAAVWLVELLLVYLMGFAPPMAS